MEILVAGGAGYIGSITSKRLLDLGHKITVVDSLEKGNRWAVDPRATFIQGNLLEKDFVKGLFKQHYDAVIDFAAYIEVKESVDNPGRYFTNNVFSALNLLEAMPLSKSDNFVFSSSAAVYGNSEIIPLSEKLECVPTSPYGESKLMVEKILKWYPTKYIALRYFNVAGAMPDGSLGQAYDPATNFIPIILKKIMNHEEISLYGSDYDTPDGSCIRDYIHVLDLAEAHVLALQALWDNKSTHGIYNAGGGKGYSNKEVLSTVEKVVGQPNRIKIEPKRPGDPAISIADNSLIKTELGFNPKYSDIETIVKTAYNWHSKPIQK